MYCVDKQTVWVSVARVGLVLGGLACLVLTPSFALAYYQAYGYSNGESPPGWMTQFDWPSWVSGANSISTYNRHGVLFGLALAIVAIALAVLIRPRNEKSRWVRRAWWMIVGGLSAVAAGSLSEYGIPEETLDPGFGFGLELLGFASIAIGTIALGWSLSREGRVSRLKCTGIALVGPVGIILGTAINGHIPSGPASLLLISAIAVGLTRRPAPSRAVPLDA